MTETVSCGFARVYLYTTKQLALSQITRLSNESQTKFKIRLLQQRYKIFQDKFSGYPKFQIDKGRHLQLYFQIK